MAVERKDRVKDQSSTVGTGTLTIDLVAPTGYRTLATHTTGATVNYLIIDSTGSNWEVGQGVWTSASQTLTRATVVASSNSNALVSFASGLKTVATLPTTDDFRDKYFDSTTTNALVYTKAKWQRWAPNTGAQTLTITGWPASGDFGELLIEGVNLGAATITWPAAINWVTADGTTTTTFSSNGVTLQTSGTDWVFLWTRDGGTTIYGKITR